MTTLRGLALCVTVALVASACTATGAETTTTALVSETEAGGASPPGSLMNRALGGTQTVQDFVIHIDMSVQTDDGAVSFYEEVLEAAGSNAGDPVPLAGGFTFAPVDSVDGEVVDADGEIIPSIAVDFGLFGATGARLEEAGELLAQDLRAAGSENEEVAELIESDDSDEARMLIEIITADYTEKRTHVGPGDLTAIDITFVSSVTPGDSITSTYMFGQTLPGTPADEEGLSAHELFAYRWNQGLVSMLGGEGGLSTVTDETVAAVGGSTIMTREAKRALLVVLGIFGAAEAVRVADNRIENREEIHLGLGRSLKVTQEGVIEYCPRGAGEECFGDISPAAVKLYFASTGALELCRDWAEILNSRNEAGGIPVSELGIDASGGGDEGEKGAEGDQTTTTTEPESPPGPVSCDPPSGPSPKPPSGHVWGDPHVRTIDGNLYDNMAVGEFLLFDNGDATIQMRAEPWPGEDSVSLVTALAFRIGDHTVSLHRDGRTWIDGDRVELTRGETIEIGGGELLWWMGGWVLVWPDGTVARVTDVTTALLLVVTPSSQPAQGLLGDNDGDPANDLVTRSGVQLEPDADDDFATFYPTYIDSWRISAEESFFHYGTGESHGSFDIEGFPARPFASRNLSGDVREAAEGVCREVGVTREDILEACILDVGVTGDESFAYQSYLIEASTPPDADSEQEPETAPLRPSAEGVSIVRVGDLTVEFGPDPPIQDPNGFSPRWQCAVTEGSFHATSRFVETPTRTFELRIEYLDAATSGTGEERFSTVIMLNAEDYAWVLNYVEHFSDAIETISLDGSTLEAHGSAFRDESLDPGLSPFSQLPDDVELQPFSLVATCDQ